MEASTGTGITGNAQDTRHAETAGRAARRWAARSKRTAAIAALGLAGFLSATACTSASPSAAPAASQSQPTTSSQSQPASTPQVQPAVQVGPSSQQVAKDVAEIAVGNGPLTALAGDGVTATYATCDPATVSNPPDVSTPTSASCDITYSDGSVWQQTVTITYDSQGDPAAASTNVGTELSQPTNE